MKKLGDQWIEVIDGQKHMVKAVERKTENQFDCSGCFYNDTHGKCLYRSQDCPIGYVAYGYIKDLGILNEKGLLPCPFCGEYPEILKGKLGYKIRHVCRDSYVMAGTGIYGTEQQAIGAWNRRV